MGSIRCGILTILGLTIMLVTSVSGATVFKLEPAQYYFADFKTSALLNSALTGDTISKKQSNQTARDIFLQRLVAAFSRDIPSFAACDWEDRKSFLSGAVLLAESKGFQTEQGLASYALAVWWLGVDFEEKSQALQSLMERTYPEVRKVQAMNEWVNAMIGRPESVAAADEALKQGLRLTEPWGSPSQP